MAWTALKTWTAGSVLTAAELNEQLRDNFGAAFVTPTDPTAAWTSFTPTLTQSATVTKTVTYAKYMKIGRPVTVNVNLACTSAGTAGNAVTVGLPVTAAASQTSIGTGIVFDLSALLNYTGIAYMATTSTVTFPITSVANLNPLGVADFTAALASGDSVSYHAVYEAAS